VLFLKEAWIIPGRVGLGEADNQGLVADMSGGQAHASVGQPGVGQPGMAQ